MSEWYPWLVSIHVIGVISWMAGLLYLPRLFVYHCGAEAGSDKSETFKVMERRLLLAIMYPAMTVSWIFGLAAAAAADSWVDGWFHVKMALVLALTGCHMLMAKWRREFAEDRNPRPERFYRIANEIPTVLMIAIVILVFVKPF